MTQTTELHEVKMLLGMALKKLSKVENSVKVRSNSAHEVIKKYKSQLNQKHETQRRNLSR